MYAGVMSRLDPGKRSLRDDWLFEFNADDRLSITDYDGKDGPVGAQRAWILDVGRPISVRTSTTRGARPTASRQRRCAVGNVLRPR